jgi:hypothetical protein
MDRVEMRLIEITLTNAVARGALDEEPEDPHARDQGA